MKTLLVVLGLCVAAFAQNAKVIALSPSDAAKSQQLHEAAIAAQKAVEDFDKEVDHKYTYDSSAAIQPVHKKGWESGVEYSEDWRFIVPKTYGLTVSGTGTLIGTWPSCGYGSLPCFTTSPAVTFPCNWGTGTNLTAVPSATITN
jgi:hypothetical protein